MNGETGLKYVLSKFPKKANKEIVKELSKIFNCNVGISKGEKSSQKTIVCYDVSIEYILDKLGEIL